MNKNTVSSSMILLLAGISTAWGQSNWHYDLLPAASDNEIKQGIILKDFKDSAPSILGTTIDEYRSVHARSSMASKQYTFGSSEITMTKEGASLAFSYPKGVAVKDILHAHAVLTEKLIRQKGLPFRHPAILGQMKDGKAPSNLYAYESYVLLVAKGNRVFVRKTGDESNEWQVVEMPTEKFGSYFLRDALLTPDGQIYLATSNAMYHRYLDNRTDASTLSPDAHGWHFKNNFSYIRDFKRVDWVPVIGSDQGDSLCYFSTQGAHCLIKSSAADGHTAWKWLPSLKLASGNEEIRFKIRRRASNSDDKDQNGLGMSALEMQREVNTLLYNKVREKYGSNPPRLIAATPDGRGGAYLYLLLSNGYYFTYYKSPYLSEHKLTGPWTTSARFALNSEEQNRVLVGYACEYPGIHQFLLRPTTGDDQVIFIGEKGDDPAVRLPDIKINLDESKLKGSFDRLFPVNETVGLLLDKSLDPEGGGWMGMVVNSRQGYLSILKYQSGDHLTVEPPQSINYLNPYFLNYMPNSMAAAEYLYGGYPMPIFLSTNLLAAQLDSSRNDKGVSHDDMDNWFHLYIKYDKDQNHQDYIANAVYANDRHQVPIHIKVCAAPGHGGPISDEEFKSIKQALVLRYKEDGSDDKPSYIIPSTREGAKEIRAPFYVSSTRSDYFIGVVDPEDEDPVDLRRSRHHVKGNGRNYDCDGDPLDITLYISAVKDNEKLGDDGLTELIKPELHYSIDQPGEHELPAQDTGQVTSAEWDDNWVVILKPDYPHILHMIKLPEFPHPFADYVSANILEFAVFAGQALDALDITGNSPMSIDKVIPDMSQDQVSTLKLDTGILHALVMWYQWPFSFWNYDNLYFIDSMLLKNLLDALGLISDIFDGDTFFSEVAICQGGSDLCALTLGSSGQSLAVLRGGGHVQHNRRHLFGILMSGHLQFPVGSASARSDGAEVSWVDAFGTNGSDTAYIPIPVDPN